MPVFAIGIAGGVLAGNGMLAPRHPEGISFVDSNVYRYGTGKGRDRMISTTDLGEGLRFVGLYLLIIVAIGGLVFWVARRRGSRTAVISVTLSIAGMWVALFVLAAPFALSQTLGGDPLWVQDLPLELDSPEQLACGSAALTAGPALECVYGATVSGEFVGTTAGPRVLLALGQFFSAVLSAAPAAAIGVICFQLLRGAPFTRVASRTLFVTALVVLVAGVGADLAMAVGRGLALAEVLPIDGVYSSVEPRFTLAVQLWPFGAALALAALATVFRYGERLQRDTDLLV